MARHLLVKKKFGLFALAPGRRLAGLPGPCNPPDESIADEAWHDGYRVLGQAELNVLLVPETFQPPRRTVVPQRPHGARQITLDDAPGPLVQFSTTRAQPVEDGSRRSLVLGSAAPLPAAPDNHHLCAVVGPSGQLLGQDTGVDEGTGQDGPGAAGGLHDARSVRSRKGDPGARRYLRTQDLRRRVAEVEADYLRATPLPDAEVRLGERSLLDRRDRHDPCILRDVDRDGRARPEGVDHDHYRTRAGHRPRSALPACVAGDHGVRSRAFSNIARL